MILLDFSVIFSILCKTSNSYLLQTFLFLGPFFLSSFSGSRCISEVINSQLSLNSAWIRGFCLILSSHSVQQLTGSLPVSVPFLSVSSLRARTMLLKKKKNTKTQPSMFPGLTEYLTPVRVWINSKWCVRVCSVASVVSDSVWPYGL